MSQFAVVVYVEFMNLHCTQAYGIVLEFRSLFIAYAKDLPNLLQRTSGNDNYDALKSHNKICNNQRPVNHSWALIHDLRACPLDLSMNNVFLECIQAYATVVTYATSTRSYKTSSPLHARPDGLSRPDDRPFAWTAK